MGTRYLRTLPSLKFPFSPSVALEIEVLPCLSHLFSSQDSYFFQMTFRQDEARFLVCGACYLLSLDGSLWSHMEFAGLTLGRWILKPSCVQGGLAGAESMRSEAPLFLGLC